MKITISVIALVAVVVVVIFSIRSVGEDVEDVRAGFSGSQTAPTDVPGNQVNVFDQGEWERPSYSQIPPRVPERTEFEIEYCWLENINEATTHFRCRGRVELPSEGNVKIKCEGFASEDQARRRTPLVTAEGQFEIGRLLLLYWEVGKSYSSSNPEIGAGRCGVFEWPS